MTLHNRLYIRRIGSVLFSGIFLMFLIGFSAVEHRADTFIMLSKISFLRWNCSFSDHNHVPVFVFPICIVIIEMRMKNFH